MSAKVWKTANFSALSPFQIVLLKMAFYKSEMPSVCGDIDTPVNFSYCWNFSAVTKNYTQRDNIILFGRKRIQDWKKCVWNKKISWNEAFELCTAAGGQLPVVLSRTNLQNLIWFLREAAEADFTEALFVGSTSKVPV